jgi:hypothetical protein
MTLGNVRSVGVRGLNVTSTGDRMLSDGRVILAAAIVFAVIVGAWMFRYETVGVSLGIVSADARPNWHEQLERPSLAGAQWRS